MTSNNIPYESGEILDFYSCTRRTWGEFYPSERWVFDHIAAERNGALGSVLDAGCACGGLGEALADRFELDSYTGVDIHAASIEWAASNAEVPTESRFIAGDILTLDFDRTFDLVVSLSCVDWNVETQRMLSRCWDLVQPGGEFVLSLRLTEGESISDIARSFQYVDFSGENRDDAEVAPYVVFSLSDALASVSALAPTPERIGAYGYWGPPSETARTPEQRLCFSVWYLRKSLNRTDEPQLELNLPHEIVAREDS